MAIETIIENGEPDPERDEPTASGDTDAEVPSGGAAGVFVVAGTAPTR